MPVKEMTAHLILTITCRVLMSQSLRSSVTGPGIDWIIDYKGTHTNSRAKGFTDNYHNPKSNAKITVYVHPSAFDYGDDFLRSVVGHEWIHVAQIRTDAYQSWFDRFGEKGANDIAEEKGWRWNNDVYPNAIGNNALTPNQVYIEMIQRTPVGYNSASPYYNGYY